ncbi:hypothetical protein GW17_00000365 [Ensete ventricosum]|nr:hypothetical protein GW17_00000365 [Ensete ventricosum]
MAASEEYDAMWNKSKKIPLPEVTKAKLRDLPQTLGRGETIGPNIPRWWAPWTSPTMPRNSANQRTGRREGCVDFNKEHPHGFDRLKKDRRVICKQTFLYPLTFLPSGDAGATGEFY